MRVVVCGGGVIGAAAAYELSRRGAETILVERWEIGGSASGKSGGFLARDWCDGTPVEELAQRSFDLHDAWAEAFGNPYGYRRIDTFGAALSVRRRLGHDPGSMAPWLAEGAVHRQELGSTMTTAQLDPRAFTRTLADASVGNGGRVIKAAVDGIIDARCGRVEGVRLADGEMIPADAVVLALGPWSLVAAQWVDLPPVYGLKGHSMVFRPSTPLPAEALFAQYEDHDGEVVTPEIVSRADGSVYVCGLSGGDPLPLDPARVLPELGGCEKLRELAIDLVPALADAEVIAEQACFRPITSDGLPLIGPAPGREGVFVATGHSVWGMLNAPGTAEALAELIQYGRAITVDLSRFAVERLPPLHRRDVEFRAG